ncbi:MAG: MotA/TolQ/ExbB proton channel family protein [Sphingomonadales bacterium]|nr:MotA/TolQ/ExbB proton channel family protein [Sphingomonadales bacterium]
MKKIISTVAALSIAGFAFMASAQDAGAKKESEAANLDQLLQLVREGRINETKENKAREAEFKARKDRQSGLLKDAKNEQARQERISVRLERTFQTNEVDLANLTERLNNRLGSLRELFGVLQQVAGDARGVFAGSLISVQYPDRGEALNDLIAKASGGTDLPSIEEIEGLWAALMDEMVQSGKVVTFPHTVWTFDGQTEEINLTRVGDFNLVGNGIYYNYEPSQGRVAELGRQPSGRFTGTIDDLTDADAGEIVAFGVDPSRGQLLSILVGKPGFVERWHQGGEVGYIISFIGLIGVAVAVWRFAVLGTVNRKVKAQMKAGGANVNNPLGRVLKVYEDNKGVDVETLELKMDEAIMKETPALETGLVFIKIISAVAPLLGLVGTVTGMIETFQSITLFGAGDPKLMAGGISKALVTTVLGLVVAIPTLLLHSFVAGISKSMIHVLEEQSAGIIAEHAEKESGNGGRS